MSATQHKEKKTLLSRIIDFMDANGGDVPLQKIYEAFKEEKVTTIRGRINEAIAQKKHIIRTSKGHYMLIGTEIEAIVENSDSRTALFEILKANLYYSLCLLDIPYRLQGQRSYVPGLRNLAPFPVISPEELQEIVFNIEKMLKDENSQIYFMIAGGTSSALEVTKYIDVFDQTSLKKAAEGSYQKLNANGTPCNMAQYVMPPEKILVYSPSGNLLKPEDTILNFAFRRPTLKRYGGYPTEKPVKMLEQIFEQGTHIGDRILDLFAGGGNSLKAAIPMKRKIHCIDISINAIENYIRPKMELLVDHTKASMYQHLKYQSTFYDFIR